MPCLGRVPEGAERYAGLGVVLAIFVSACAAGVIAIEKISPHAPEQLIALAIAAVVAHSERARAFPLTALVWREMQAPQLAPSALLQGTSSVRDRGRRGRRTAPAPAR